MMAMDQFILSTEEKVVFKQHIWDFYHQEGRSFIWRHIDDPYKIVVSEIMLQQTQTHRVAQKYPLFVQTFIDFKILADAPLRDVLFMWQGLGYNRRGKYLHEIAQKVVNEFDGVLPDDPKVLETFPGIGKATAASICAFAFNQATIFIETNIRTVFIHHFFPHENNIKDQEIMPLIAQTVEQGNPREWYYALMDYGVMLKKRLPNPSRKSSHHTRQTTFEGSDRQIRGMILKLLTTHEYLHINDLELSIDREQHRIYKALSELIQEGFIEENNQKIAIKTGKLTT
jgi:A/G-specific adenine glycosylase